MPAQSETLVGNSPDSELELELLSHCGTAEMRFKKLTQARQLLLGQYKLLSLRPKDGGKILACL